jgi:hypothetical protein
LDEHLRLGKMSLTDLGVYLLLHRWCEWRWGIYYGCAATIASLMGGRAEKAEVQRSLQNLRRFQFVNYPLGTGSRGSYRILIHKYLPRVGELRGYRLNAFALNSLEQPLYECLNGGRTEDGLSYDGGRTVEQLRTNGGRTEDEPLQEYKEYKSIRILDFKSPKVGRLVGRGPQPAAAPPVEPSISDGQGGTEKDPEPVETEYLPDPGRRQSGELPVPSEEIPVPVESITESAPVIDPSDAPAKLAVRFYEYQGRPAKFQSDLSAWTEKFRLLLQTYGDELPEVMDYAFKTDPFWSEKLIRGQDPLGYFEQKLADGIIVEKFRQLKAARKNKKGSSFKPKEAKDGEQSTRHGRRTSGKQPVNNQSAAEEAKRRVAERLGC